MASLSFHSLLELRRGLENGTRQLFKSTSPCIHPVSTLYCQRGGASLTWPPCPSTVCSSWGEAWRTVPDNYLNLPPLYPPCIHPVLSERWGKPHMASLSFHSLLELRRGLENGTRQLFKSTSPCNHPVSTLYCQRGGASLTWPPSPSTVCSSWGEAWRTVPDNYLNLPPPVPTLYPPCIVREVGQASHGLPVLPQSARVEERPGERYQTII